MSTTLSWGVAYLIAAGVLGLTSLAVPQLRQLPVGKDKRVSTSKVQFWLWMLAIAFALFAMLAAWGLEQLGATDNPVGDAFEAFRDQGLDETYLLLLGLPAGAAIGAKAITATKVANGTIDKHDKPKDDRSGALKELVSDDAGVGDLGDTQYFLLNLLALFYFLLQFVASPESGLPAMPDTLVGLTGVAAAAYVTKKGVYREPPVLWSLDPPAARPGATVHVRGSELQSKESTDAASSVVFGSVPARALDGSTPERLVVQVPPGAPAGPVKVRVVRPAGAESAMLDFNVLDPRPTIRAARPSRVVLGTDRALVVEGIGFLAGGEAAGEGNAVLLAGRQLAGKADAQWTDGRVTVALPVDDPAIQALQLDAGSVDLVVHAADGSASEPTAIELLTTRPLVQVSQAATPV